MFKIGDRVVVEMGKTCYLAEIYDPGGNPPPNEGELFIKFWGAGFNWINKSRLHLIGNLVGNLRLVEFLNPPPQL